MIYLGLSIDSFEGSADMIYYVLVDFGILLLSRFFTIFLLSGLVYCFRRGKEQALNFKEIVLVGFSGMIRGSIAYALVVKLAFKGVDKTNAIEYKGAK